jgi:hypothetical protein
LSVGFTLLHHPLYDAAFAYLDATRCVAQWVEAIRIGAPARHDAHAMLDAGIHAAAVAAYLEVPAGISAAYCEHAQMRRTTIHTDRGSVSIDEIDGTVETPMGRIAVRHADALELELCAWMAGEHRGTPAVALAAQDMVDDAITESMVAA